MKFSLRMVMLVWLLVSVVLSCVTCNLHAQTNYDQQIYELLTGSGAKVEDINMTFLTEGGVKHLRTYDFYGPTMASIWDRDMKMLYQYSTNRTSGQGTFVNVKNPLSVTNVVSVTNANMNFVVDGDGNHLRVTDAAVAYEVGNIGSMVNDVVQGNAAFHTYSDGGNISVTNKVELWKGGDSMHPIYVQAVGGADDPWAAESGSTGIGDLATTGGVSTAAAGEDDMMSRSAALLEQADGNSNVVFQAQDMLIPTFSSWYLADIPTNPVLSLPIVFNLPVFGLHEEELPVDWSVNVNLGDYPEVFIIRRMEIWVLWLVSLWVGLCIVREGIS